MNKIFIVFLTTILLFISGCTGVNVAEPKNEVVKTQETPQATSNTLTPTSTSDQSIKFDEMQKKLDRLEENISILQEKVNSVGILTPSRKQLIPNIPFKIVVKFADWQTPLIYTFKENGFVDIADAGYTDSDAATYKLYKNNNTITIESQKYNYYGLVIYDDYVASIYKNGWPNWVAKYTLMAPRFNPETQKYELN